MTRLQGGGEYHAPRCCHCQNEHSLLSQFTPLLEISGNRSRVIQFVTCSFSHHTMEILALTLQVLHQTFASNKRSEMLKHILLSRAQTSNNRSGQSRD